MGHGGLVVGFGASGSFVGGLRGRKSFPQFLLIGGGAVRCRGVRSGGGVGIGRK